MNLLINYVSLPFIVKMNRQILVNYTQLYSTSISQWVASSIILTSKYLQIKSASTDTTNSPLPNKLTDNLFSMGIIIVCLW